MTGVKWDIREIKSQHSPYVDSLIQVNILLKIAMSKCIFLWRYMDTFYVLLKYKINSRLLQCFASVPWKVWFLTLMTTTLLYCMLFTRVIYQNDHQPFLIKMINWYQVMLGLLFPQDYELDTKLGIHNLSLLVHLWCQNNLTAPAQFVLNRDFWGPLGLGWLYSHSY